MNQSAARDSGQQPGKGETVPAADDPTAYLAAGRFVDSSDPDIAAFAARVAGGLERPLDKALALYRAVRDDIAYDPYHLPGKAEAFRAGRVLADGRGFCIGKAALMTAAARTQGIPARVGYADVRNHLATRRLRELMGSDLFVWHGYAQLHLDGQWVKATPAFGKEICDRFGVAPLEFDGRTDSLFQAHNGQGDRYMEYVQDRGQFADVPAETILEAFRATYPVWVAERPAGDFGAEAAQERDPPG
ncbi:MAG: transglutaminase family protein [Sneathiellaceae bacterium]